MSLTSRLSTFFLAGLAMVLAGFSTSIYLLADDYLERRERDRLYAAIGNLQAMAEVDTDGVEWEGRQRGVGNLSSDVLWAVHIGDGTLVNQSRDLGADDPLLRPPENSQPGFTTAQLGKHRRSGRMTLHVDGKIAAEKHATLVISAALSTKPRNMLLQRLALALAGVSGGIWLLALFASRWFCRRALRPVTAMARQAQGMQAEDIKERLDVPRTHDEIDALGQSFNGLLDRLHTAIERQRRFAGEASHQLRTPLTALLGQIEVALRRERDSEEYRRALEQVHEQGEQLRRIVEMLLFLTRADAESQVGEFVDVDMAQWVPEQLKQWDTHLRRSDLRVVSAGPCRAKVHPALLGQLFFNLIDNALKYSEPDTPVTIMLERDADQVKLIVEDEGVGIRSEDLPRLFEPFFRSSQARASGSAGTGLGLSVAKRIAEAMGGTLTAKPREGRGSVFILSVPQTGRPMNS